MDKRYMVPANSLGPTTTQGWLTKIGEKVKNWKHRWFILKDDTLYYYKKPNAPKPQGVIILRKGVKVFKIENKKSPFTFAVQTDQRTFLMHGETMAESEIWVNAIRNQLEQLDKGSSGAKPEMRKPESGTSPTSGSSLSTSPRSAIPDKAAPSRIATSTDMMKLPDPILLIVCTYLDRPSLVSVDRVCRRFHGLARQANEMHGRSAERRKRLHASQRRDETARARFQGAKQMVDWLAANSQVSDFWDIFTATVPQLVPVPAAQVSDPAGSVQFEVCTSMDLQKTTWRAEGPQHLFITPMVHFFLRVGAPDTEIERLNNFGATIRPPRIGFWIDVSNKGGLDGGWYFPFDSMPLSAVLQAVETGSCVQKLREWAVQHWGTPDALCYYVGRDMGMEPPRQTEVRMMLPGTSLRKKLRVALDAYAKFGFPAPPQDIYDVINSSYHYQGSEPQLGISICLASDDNFVRIAILQSKPTSHCFQMLASNLSSEKYRQLIAIEGALGATLARIEYQYLREAYGYRVYPEGFGITCAYSVGKEYPPAQ